MTKPDFNPTASIETLRRRAKVIRKVREFFEDRDFFHVETPVLSHDTVVDRYLEPIGVEKSRLGLAGGCEEKLWLQTSPEFGMKRLLAAGAEAIYQITKSFRAEEAGGRHNPEFSMLEWYRVGQTMAEAMDLLAEFAQTILERESTEQLTYRQTFRRYAGVDPFESPESELEDLLRNHGVEFAEGERPQDRDGWLNLILGCVIESQLGVSQPVIVYDWPASQSALAMVRDESPPVAERFELYIEGVELANGYHELLDAEELERRNQIVNQQRVEDGRQALPSESRLLDAMRSGLPDCCGVALGIDRLVMVALGIDSISEVLAFDIQNA